MKGFQKILHRIQKRSNLSKHRLLSYKTRRNAFFASLLLILAAIFFGIQIIDTQFVNTIAKNSARTIPFAIPTPADFPTTSLVLGASTSSALNAEAAIIMDNDSKVILFAKNPSVRFSMASTTKIMTAFVGLSHFQMQDVLTLQDDRVEGSTVGFKKGEQVTFEDLLYAMLLPSGNDAAVAIAQNYPGGQNAFIEAMNKKAKELSLFQTHYADPSGLDDEGDYTTVVDLARLGSVALQNETLSKIVSTKEKAIQTVSGNVYTLVSLNKLLGSNGVTGIKTGFTDEAGGVLLTSKKEGDKTFILVVMKSQDRFLDTQYLLSLISGKVMFAPMDR